VSDKKEIPVIKIANSLFAFPFIVSKHSSYHKVVVFEVCSKGCTTLKRMLWIGSLIKKVLEFSAFLSLPLGLVIDTRAQNRSCMEGGSIRVKPF